MEIVGPAAVIDLVSNYSGEARMPWASAPASRLPLQQAPTLKRKTDDTTTNGAARKRRATSRSTQTNTLDSWFKPTTKAASLQPTPPTAAVTSKADCVATPLEKSVSSSMMARVNRDHVSPFEKQASSKKMVQRRILLSDLCRVCESARADDSTRCELKCVDCEMTVHKSCYDMKGNEVVPEQWRCRHCQFGKDEPEEDNGMEQDTDSAKDEADKTDGAADCPLQAEHVVFPTHEPRGAEQRFDGLYQDFNFATVFLFLKRFRRLGMKISVDLTIESLAQALLAPTENGFLSKLHTRLLKNLGVTISRHGWVVSMVQYLKAMEYPSATSFFETSVVCVGSQSDWLDAYHQLPVHDRAFLLKLLCETQFDENDALVEKIGNQEDYEGLRDGSIGLDASKRTYFVLEDIPSATEGSAWVCRCNKSDGSDWQTISDDLESLEAFLNVLSLSTETLDLQLWQTLRLGVCKSLIRREKKKRALAQRVARLPRALGNSGLDLAAIIQDGSGRGHGRSLRTRRAVVYRGWSDGDDDDEEEEEDEVEEEEEEDEEEGEEEEEEEMDDGVDRGHRETASRKRRRMPEEQSTRSSRRLRRTSRSPSSQASTSEGESDQEVDEEEEGSDSVARRTGSRSSTRRHSSRLAD